MLNRNLVAAVSKRGLLLRVGKDRYRDALAWPGARPMEVRGRAMEEARSRETLTEARSS